jgi:hypothetical protein
MMRKHSSTGTTLYVPALTVFITSALLYAGPLNPPAGPVAPTLKPLTEIEPRIAVNATNTPGDPLGDLSPSVFKITQPGSYYLTGNITGVSGMHGIELAASNVTIDLNGFALLGVPGSLAGIFRVTSASDAFVIRNGTVASWGGRGLDLGFASPSTNRGAIIESVISTQNVGVGFRVPDGAVLIGCVATRNGDNGIAFGNAAAVRDCVSEGNAGDGFTSGFGATFDNCHARANTGNGFSSTGPCAFTNCSATNQTLDGFVTNRSNVVGCKTAFNSGVGFRASASLVQSCMAIGNSAGGMVGSTGNSFVYCLVSGGTVGIDITAAGNRVDSNNVSGATTGIRATGTGNFIVRNSVTGGTTYNIVAGNSAGPVVNAAGMATLTNPMANFSY